jgi:hypothetical protein
MSKLSKKALSDIDNYNQLRQDEIDLVNHIKAINKKSKQEMIDNPSWYIGMMVEDYQHWLDMDVTNIKQFERYLDETTLYEAVSTATTKSYARTVIAESKYWSDEKFQKEMKFYGVWANEEIERENNAKDEAYKKFENQVKKNMELGAETRKQAINWILTAEDLENEKDVGYICYNLGLSYDKEYLFKEIH